MENTFYPINDYRSYLAHHGVKGMKWGVRKQRYEARRKAKYMKKYGISSKQYDSVREKSLQRHLKGTKVRNVVRGVKAGVGGAYGLAMTSGMMASNSVYNQLAGTTGGGKETAMVGAMATAAAVGVQDIWTKAEWAIGRRVVDWALESPEYEQMANKKK